MGKEIERKFLVEGDEWRGESKGTRIRQGYLVTELERSVRVRVRGETGTLTVKGESRGAVRAEYEYAIPKDDAEAMIDDLCLRPLIEKTRHVVAHGGQVWEIDVFEGDNAGLVVAELELDDEDESFERPPWLGDEVTDDPRYYNANLVENPFRTW